MELRVSQLMALCWSLLKECRRLDGVLEAYESLKVQVQGLRSSSLGFAIP